MSDITQAENLNACLRLIVCQIGNQMDLSVGLNGHMFGVEYLSDGCN